MASRTSGREATRKGAWKVQHAHESLVMAGG
jgi:hypothetical protein